MQQHLDIVRIETRGRGMVDVTEPVRKVLRESALTRGLLTLHLRHTSASLLIQENADPSVRADFERFFAKLVVDGDRMFEHDAEGPDDMPAHIRSALTQTNLSIPFADAALLLGTWQAIYLWEHRRAAHRRELCVHVLGA